MHVFISFLPYVVDDLTKMGYVEQLLTLLNTEHAQHHEHIMSALLELLTDNPTAVQEAQRPELGARDFLQQRKSLLKDKPEFQVS